jgi:IMP dehydrogenase
MIREGLTFDDLLLIPKHSTVKSRANVDLTIKLKKNNFSTTIWHPLVPANMSNIFEYDMALAVYLSGGMGFIHRFIPVTDQKNIIAKLVGNSGDAIFNHIGISVGVKDSDKEVVKLFVDSGIKLICVDVAHGDSELCINMTNWIANNYPDVFIISGNVATGSGAKRLWEAGADVVKVGVGSGSLCSTRIETGNGVPQMTALMDVTNAKQEITGTVWHKPLAKYLEDELISRPLYIMSDGGARSAGDLVKALSFADLIMTGNLFAGTTQCPGKTMYIDNICYKEYVGSSTHSANHIEGVSALVPCRGDFSEVLTKLLEGIRSGCSYQNAHNLAELRQDPEFIKISNAGLVESHPHSVRVVK